MKPPSVVRIRRKGGVIVCNCDIYIGREIQMGGWDLKKSKWHNPFKKSDGSSIETILKKYEHYVRASSRLMHSLKELSGKRLGCWCHPNPCHGDVLRKLFLEQFPQSESKGRKKVLKLTHSENEEKIEMESGT